jgi:hypothetical protein
MLECGCLDFGPKTLVAGAAMRDGVAESVLNGEENMAAAGLLGQPFFAHERTWRKHNGERYYEATGEERGVTLGDD